MPDSDMKWKVADLVVKGVGAAVISAIVGFYGHKVQLAQHNAALRAEQYRDAIIHKTERLTALVDISSKQKDLDVNISMRMFETMFARYFGVEDSKNKGDKLHEQILLLRLIALNFQDVPINLKPLFEELDYQMAGEANLKMLKQNLKAIAKEVARRQAFRVTFDSGFDSGPKPIKPGERIVFKNLNLQIDVDSVSGEDAKITLVQGKRRIGPFSVGYYDFPIIDNVKITKNIRVAVMLLESNNAEATIRMIAFQSDLASDRFDIKELSRDLSRITYETDFSDPSVK